MTRVNGLGWQPHLGAEDVPRGHRGRQHRNAEHCHGKDAEKYLEIRLPRIVGSEDRLSNSKATLRTRAVPQ